MLKTQDGKSSELKSKYSTNQRMMSQVAFIFLNTIQRFSHRIAAQSAVCSMQIIGKTGFDKRNDKKVKQLDLNEMSTLQMRF